MAENGSKAIDGGGGAGGGASEMSAKELFFRRLIRNAHIVAIRKSKPVLTLIKYWFVVSLGLSAVGYLFDVYSDVALSVGYFRQGDYYWGATTFILFAIPLVIFTVFICSNSFSSSRQIRRDKLLLAASICLGLPVALLILAGREELKGNTDMALTRKKQALMAHLIEIVIESLLQFCLQLYIVGNKNQIMFLQIVSIVTSFLSLAFGIINGVLGFFAFHRVRQYEAMLKLKVIFTLLFGIWLVLQIVVFLPSIAFFSSLRNHSHLAYLIFIAYLFLHLFLSTCSSFVYPINGYLISPSFMRIKCEDLGHRRLSQLVSIFLQLLFCFSSLFFTSVWFVSVAPFVDDSTLGRVTDVVWPETPSALRKWIGPNVSDPSVNTSDYSWAICPASKSNLTFSLDSFASFECCLTDLAALIYSIIFILCLVSFFYHCSLVATWPILNKTVFSEEKEFVSEWKRLIDEADANLPAKDDFKHQSLKLIEIVQHLDRNDTPELRQDLLNQFQNMIDKHHFLATDQNFMKMRTLSPIDRFIIKLFQRSANNNSNDNNNNNNNNDDDNRSQLSEEEREVLMKTIDSNEMLARVVEITLCGYIAAFRRWDDRVLGDEGEFLVDFYNAIFRWKISKLIRTNRILTKSRLQELESALTIVAESERRSDIESRVWNEDDDDISEQWEYVETELRTWFEKAKKESSLSPSECGKDVTVDRDLHHHPPNLEPAGNNNNSNDENGENEKLMEDILQLLIKIRIKSKFENVCINVVDGPEASIVWRLHGALAIALKLLLQLPTENAETFFTKKFCDRIKREIEKLSKTINGRGYLHYDNRYNDGDEKELLQLKTILEENFISTFVETNERRRQRRQKDETIDDDYNEFPLDKKVKTLRDTVEIIDGLISDCQKMQPMRVKLREKRDFERGSMRKRGALQICESQCCSGGRHGGGDRGGDSVGDRDGDSENCGDGDRIKIENESDSDLGRVVLLGEGDTEVAVVDVETGLTDDADAALRQV